MPVAFADADIPFPFQPLIPLARRCGIGNDVAREMKVEAASLEELRTLKETVGPLVASLIEWLGGDAARTLGQNPGYQALSCLLLSIESAELRLSSSTAT